MSSTNWSLPSPTSSRISEEVAEPDGIELDLRHPLLDVGDDVDADDPPVLAAGDEHVGRPLPVVADEQDLALARLADSARILEHGPHGHLGRGDSELIPAAGERPSTASAATSAAAISALTTFARLCDPRLDMRAMKRLIEAGPGDASLVEREQALPLGVERAAVGGGELARTTRGAASPSRPSISPPPAPSMRNVLTDCGVLMLKTRARCSSGRICVRRAWTSRVESQTGRKRGGAGASGSGSGRRGRSTSCSPRLAAKPAQLQPLERRVHTGDREAGPVRDVLWRAGREAAQVAADQIHGRLPLVDLWRRPEPTLGIGEQVRAAALPGARGRRADEVDPQVDPVHPRRSEADQLLELGARRRPFGEPLADPACGRGHLPRAERLAVGAQPALPPRGR